MDIVTKFYPYIPSLVNWQKLKEGNTSFENSIHTVANTYVKTEENLKRTLQLQ